MSTAIGDFESGKSVEGDDRLAASGEPSVLKVSAVSFQGFRPLEHKAILRTTAAGLSVWPKRNQVLVTRANTPDLVGAAVWVSADHPDRYLPDKIWQTQLDASSLTHPRWLVYLLTMQALRHAISVRATGTSGSMKNISQKAFLQIKIPLPPLPEQQKIAAILSTWDATIEKTRDLIAAKQQQKKALMQQLITGKRRLPGFANSQGPVWNRCSGRSLRTGKCNRCRRCSLRFPERTPAPSRAC
jgi:type I restriction enzyme, S subunit